MRLLKTDTLEFRDFDYGNIPQYAILSHRWGSEELTLQEMEAGVINKHGYKKVQQFCSRAKADGFDYGWVDTCCINKTSSAELSEAINSMYLWYYQAERCYAYLVDVPSKSNIEDSEWFARGWTLQELVAPSEVYFVDEHWNDLGTKRDLQQVVSKCTGIPINILSGDDDLETASIAQRMSWAANRKTQRLEDRAYSLMGIFGINMPLLYGEGERAFIRLQEEIMKVSDDHSIFAWESSDSRGGILATSPEAFKDSKNIIPFNHFNDPNDSSTMEVMRISSRYYLLVAPILVKLLLDNGAKVDFKDEKFVETPLLIAAEKGLEDIVELLLDKGADVNSFDRPNDTPLGVASKAGHYGTVKLLLDNGARVDLTHYRYKHTPLQEAAAWGHESVVELLLDRGADINARDPRGRSPLRLASSSGHENIVRLLIERGAEVVERGAEVDDNVRIPPSGYKIVNKVLQDKGAEAKPKEKKSGNFSINLFKKT
ncbi:hypothetical protein A0O28_0070390 [Trichoderma guizhouense]|uniref:Uncharacterized protein n=1 Tax=Trichoderma guizhouense TaxID=1491466 RepID=A0A1T3D105_9HYPO|nr:hypothetical protein A0O28_0070390 [Trichoderma guizhouense]